MDKKTMDVVSALLAKLVEKKVLDGNDLIEILEVG